MLPPRRHHYLPKTHLKRFSKASRGKYFIWMVDLISQSSVCTNIENVAHIRDYYRLDPDANGRDEFEVEKSILGECESKAAPVIDRIVAEKTLPNNDSEREKLFNFLSFLAMRVPPIRSSLEEQAGMFAKEFLRKTVFEMSKERFSELSMQSGGGDLELHEFVDFVNSDVYSIEMSIGEQVELMVTQARKLGPILASRNWGVLETSNNAFISSDCPVLLRWSNDHELSDLAPRFEFSETEVLIPLSPHVCLLGQIEKTPKNMKISQEVVADINSETVLAAGKYLFSNDLDFLWMTSHGEILEGKKIHRWKDLIELYTHRL